MEYFGILEDRIYHQIYSMPLFYRLPNRIYCSILSSWVLHALHKFPNILEGDQRTQYTEALLNLGKITETRLHPDSKSIILEL